jgi:hypothetical protein
MSDDRNTPNPFGDDAEGFDPNTGGEGLDFEALLRQAGINPDDIGSAPIFAGEIHVGLNPQTGEVVSFRIVTRDFIATLDAEMTGLVTVFAEGVTYLVVNGVPRGILVTGEELRQMGINPDEIGGEEGFDPNAPGE